MLCDNMQFHNVAQLRRRDGLEGRLLMRYPYDTACKMDVAGQLGNRGAQMSEQASGCEIRFVTEAASWKLTISSPDEEGQAMVMRGDCFHSSHRLPAGRPVTLSISGQGALWDEAYPGESAMFHDFAFSPAVWRVCFGRHCAAYHHMETYGAALRAPEPHELPAKTGLVYGSSISQCAGASHYTDCYIAHAAYHLRCDFVNKALGGACLCESSTTDYLAALEGWDFAVLELGVNMRRYHTPQRFEERMAYLVDRLRAAHPNKHIALVTVYPNRAEPESAARQAAYNESLRACVHAQSSPYLHLIEGERILSGYRRLTCDLLHPSNLGHAAMGQNLADALREILQG